MEAYATGVEQIEVVAVGPDEVGVLALPRHGRPAPETPVGAYLSTL